MSQQEQQVQQAQQSYQSQQSQLMQLFTLYNANKDEPHRNQLIDFMNSMPLDAWQSEVLLNNLEKDIKDLIVAAKLTQITSGNSSFTFPLSSSLDALIKRFVIYRINYQVKLMSSEGGGAMASSDGNLAATAFFLTQAAQHEFSAQSDDETTRSPRAKRARVAVQDSIDNPYRLAWVRQFARCLNNDLDNWIQQEVLFDTPNVLMSCYNIHADNFGFRRKLFLTKEYVFAQVISTQIVGFERLLLEDAADFWVYSKHKNLAQIVLNLISTYYPDRSAIMANTLPNLDSFAKNKLDLSEEEFEVYKSSMGYLGIKMLFDGFTSFMNNPNRLSNGLDDSQLNQCRLNELSFYHPDSVLTKLLIDVDGIEGFRYLSRATHNFMADKNYESIIDCPLKDELISLENQRKQLLTWEKAITAGRVKPSYTLEYESTLETRKTVFVLLDTSTSMAWPSNQDVPNPNPSDDEDDEDAPIISRWDKAKEFLFSMLEQLNDDDRIAIILFNDSVRTLLPDLITVGSIRDDFPELIDDITPSGGTRILGAFGEVHQFIVDTEDFDPNLSQIVIVTDDEINQASIDGDDDIRYRYEVDTGFTGAYPSIFAVKTLADNQEQVISQVLVDSLNEHGSLMNQLKVALPNLNFVVNVHDTDGVNNLFYHLRCAYSGFSTNQVNGNLNIYCEYMPESDSDAGSDSDEGGISSADSIEEEIDIEIDIEPAGSNYSSNSDESDDTESDHLDTEQAAQYSLMQLSQSVVNSVFESIPNLNLPIDENINEYALSLIEKNGLVDISISMQRSFINWFKKDFFDQANILSWLVSSICFNRHIDQGNILRLPEDVQKLIFSYVTSAKKYVNPSTNINLKHVDFISPALRMQICSEEQKDFIVKSLSSKISELIEEIKSLEDELQRGVNRSITRISNNINLCRRKLTNVAVPQNRLHFDSKPYFLSNWEQVLHDIESSESIYHEHVVLSHIPLMPPPIMPYAKSILESEQEEQIDDFVPDCLVS